MVANKNIYYHSFGDYRLLQEVLELDMDNKHGMTVCSY